MTTIYVTKYAFTHGVFACEGSVEEDGFATCRVDGGYTQYFHGKEFHLTENEARTDFERRRAAKLKSLENSMANIRNAEFRVAHK